MVPYADIDRASRDILGALGRGGELTLAELANNTKLPYDTVVRVVETLLDDQRVESRHDEATGMEVVKLRTTGISSLFQKIFGT